MRRKYIYDPETKEMVEVSPEYQSGSKSDAINNYGALLTERHYHNLRATDGADISSRRKHKEYMRRHGLTTADDFKNEWSRAKEKREHYMQHGGSIRRQDIFDAIRKLEKR